jgi:hypothetical protein
MKRLIAALFMLVSLVSISVAQSGTGRLPAPGTRATPRADNGPVITDIRDGGFEGSDSGSLLNNDWTYGSTNFGSPICTVAACGNGAGTVGPNTGDVFLWFGGIGGFAETAFVEQTVLLPQADDLYLAFGYRIGTYDAGTVYGIEILVDGNLVYTLTPLAVANFYQTDYVDLTAYADGLAHVIRFDYAKDNGTSTGNISVDDIVLYKGEGNRIANGDMEDLSGSDWTIFNESGDKQKCDNDPKFFSYTGNCAFVFTGGLNGNATLRQVISIPPRGLPEVGHRAPPYYSNYAGAWVQTKGGAKGKLVLKLKLDDATKLKGKKTLNSAGAYSWQQVAPLTYLNGQFIVSAQLMISIRTPFGKLYVDDVEVFEVGYY